MARLERSSSGICAKITFFEIIGGRARNTDAREFVRGGLFHQGTMSPPLRFGSRKVLVLLLGRGDEDPPEAARDDGGVAGLGDDHALELTSGNRSDGHRSCHGGEVVE